MTTVTPSDSSERDRRGTGATDSYLDQTLRRFLEQVAAREPAPGGGSAAAVTASLAAALVAMAARYSAEQVESSEVLVATARRLSSRAADLADADACAYAAVLAARRATRGPDPANRQAHVRAALEQASLVPLETAQIGAETAGLAAELAAAGNDHLRGDAVTALLLAEAAARAAAQLVRINVETGGCDEELVRRAAGSEAAAADAVRSVRRGPSDAD